MAGPAAEPTPWSRLALPVAVVLSLVGTWPLLPSLVSGELVGHPGGDLADHVQGAWWFAQELLAGRLPAETGLTHAPEVRSLWYVDPVGALLALPWWGLGAAVAWNGALLAQILGATAVAWACARDLTRSPWAATVAAAVAVPSPYLLGVLHSGLSEMVGLTPLVAAVWASLRATGRDPQGRPGTTRMALLAGLFIGLCAWQAPYYAAFAGVFLLCCLPGGDWPARLKPAGIAVGTSLVVAAPALAAIGWTLSGSDGAVSTANAPGWAPGGPLPATDLLTFFRPDDYFFPDTPAMGNPGILHVNKLGGVALGLGLWGALRRPEAAPLRGPALLYGALMLGPGLVVGGRHLGLPLPLALLYAGPSPFDLVHHPYRMVSVGMVLLGLLAALGSLHVAPRWRGLLAGAVLVETVAASPGPWPVVRTPLPDPAPWQELAEGAVLDWPPDATTWNRRHQLAQVEHGHPVPWGVNVFLPDPLARDPLVHQLLRGLDDPRQRARNRDVPAHSDPVPAPQKGESALSAMGFGQIVVHRPALSDREWRRTGVLLTQALGPPAAEGAWGARWTLR